MGVAGRAWQIPLPQIREKIAMAATNIRQKCDSDLFKLLVGKLVGTGDFTYATASQ